MKLRDKTDDKIEKESDNKVEGKKQKGLKALANS